jgi:hypothetical protein
MGRLPAPSLYRSCPGDGPAGAERSPCKEDTNTREKEKGTVARSGRPFTPWKHEIQTTSRKKTHPLRRTKIWKLIVIEKKELGRHATPPRWLCKCDCGQETTPSQRDLLHGDTKSCGCLRGWETASHGVQSLREKQLYYRYHITPKKHLELLQEQNFLCAICKRKVDKSSPIDHDHSCCPEGAKSCGKCIRGILCTQCNRGIGSFMDDSNRLRNAAIYLEKEWKTTV